MPKIYQNRKKKPDSLRTYEQDLHLVSYFKRKYIFGSMRSVFRGHDWGSHPQSLYRILPPMFLFFPCFVLFFLVCFLDVFFVFCVCLDGWFGRFCGVGIFWLARFVGTFRRFDFDCDNEAKTNYIILFSSLMVQYIVILW